MARRSESLAVAMASGWLARVSRAVLAVRLYGVGLIVLSWILVTPSVLQVVVTLLIGATAVAVVVGSTRVVRALIRRPWLLVADVGVGLVLGVVSAPQMSYLYYLTSVALVAGMVARIAWVTVVAVLTTVCALVVMSPLLGSPDTAQNLQLLPVVAIFSISALATRALLSTVVARLDQAEAESELAARSGAAAERGRIALDLHDSLGKTLEGVLLSVTALQSRLPGSHHARALAGQVEGDVRAAAAQARMLMLELQHDPGTGLSAAVRAYAQRWAGRCGIALDLDAPDCPPVEPAVSHALLAMLTECLANVEDHAQSQRAAVALQWDAHRQSVTLVVRDHGRGLVPEALDDDLASRGHLGLVGLRRRAASLGGRAEITDAAPGTRVTITMPAQPGTPADPPLLIDLTRDPVEVAP